MDHNDLNFWMQICGQLLLLGSSWMVFFKMRRIDG